MILRPQKLKQKTRSDIQTQGFSLIEVMVSFTIFTLVLMFTMGAMFALITANRKAQATKVVMNNLNFALEGMARNIRVGENYNCITSAVPGAQPQPGVVKNCSPAEGVKIGFRASTGEYIIYQYNSLNKHIEISKDEGISFIPITAPEVSIENFSLYVTGTSRGFNDPQPIVTIVLGGTAGITSAAQTIFDIQTTITQRIPDF